MKTLLEKFVAKAVIPSDRSEEEAATQVTSLSVVAQNLFGVERVTRHKLEYKAAQVRSESKFVKFGWQRLSLEPLGWTTGLINIKPAFSIFRIDDPNMRVRSRDFERPNLMPPEIATAFRPAFEIVPNWNATFQGVLPAKVKETITKAAPLFTIQHEYGQVVSHLYLLCEEKSWENVKKDQPQNFILVGWDGNDLWLVEDYIEPLSFDQFMKIEFADLGKAPDHLSLPQYNPYQGVE
ncbi:MAG TPA: hypothetical protein VIJ93_13695 [bacterium]